jgi:hypothetical protein
MGYLNSPKRNGENGIPNFNAHQLIDETHPGNQDGISQLSMIEVGDIDHPNLRQSRSVKG